jgi:hypothetical protein
MQRVHTWYARLRVGAPPCGPCATGNPKEVCTPEVNPVNGDTLLGGIGDTLLGGIGNTLLGGKASITNSVFSAIAISFKLRRKIY